MHIHGDYFPTFAPNKNVIHLHKQIIENLEHGPSSHLSKHLLLRHSLWPTGRCELPNCLDAQWSAPTIVPETVGVIMVGVATQRKIKSIQHFLLVISGILLDTQLWSYPASRKNIVIHWSSCVQLNSSSIFIRNPAMPFPPCRHLAIQLAPSIAWSCDGSSGSSAWTPFGSCDWCFSAPWLQGTSSGRWDGVWRLDSGWWLKASNVGNSYGCNHNVFISCRQRKETILFIYVYKYIYIHP